MRHFILLAALLPLSVAAETLTWNPPTERQDGTPLDPATELSEYRLVCGDVVTPIPATVEQGEEYAFQKHEVLPGYGEHECYMTAVDTDGLESEASGSVVLAWEQKAPVAPTNVLLITE